MLQKRIDIGYIAIGTAIASVAMNKGTVVVIQYVGGVEKAIPCALSTTAGVKGFAFKTVRNDEGTYKDNDTIAIGERMTVCSLVRGNVWATTEFTGAFVAGDKLAIVDGKLVAVAAGVAMFEVVETEAAGRVYTDALLNVRVL